MTSETEFEALLKAVQTRTRGAMRTIIPGEVLSFNAATQTATVRVSVASWRMDPDLDEPVAFFPEPIANCPVYYPGGAGWSTRTPIEAGDRCLILVAERSIDEWMATGNRVAALDLGRRFDLTDAIVLPGLRPAADPLADFNDESFEVIHENGTVLRLNPDGTVYLGNSTTGVAEQLDALRSMLATLISDLGVYILAAQADPVTGAAATTFTGEITAYSAALTALSTNIDTLTE